MLATPEQKIRDLMAELAKKERELEEAMAAKDAQIAARDEEIARRERIIENIGREIQGRDARDERKDGEIKRRDEALAEVLAQAKQAREEGARREKDLRRELATLQAYTGGLLSSFRDGKEGGVDDRPCAGVPTAVGDRGGEAARGDGGLAGVVPGSPDGQGQGAGVEAQSGDSASMADVQAGYDGCSTTEDAERGAAH